MFVQIANCMISATKRALVITWKGGRFTKPYCICIALADGKLIATTSGSN